jgi:protein-tyrosine phosphatase
MSSWFYNYGYGVVHPDLIVGAYPVDRHDVIEIAGMHVDRVLNLVQDAEYRPGERAEVESAYARLGIVERRLDLVDYGHLPAEQIDRAVDTLLEWLEDDHRVYVHCRAGWQRSAAVAAGTVALREGLTIEDALDVVRVRKPTAAPLPHQRNDLIDWWLTRR